MNRANARVKKKKKGGQEGEKLKREREIKRNERDP